MLAENLTSRRKMRTRRLWLQITGEDACKLLEIKTRKFPVLQAVPKTSQHSSARDKNISILF